MSDFNIYCLDRVLTAELEMMTLVMSSAGNVTDSHTDDSDGSNHCFVGKKLWLMWDRLEGQHYGLQDVEHDLVAEQAAFDMRAFLRLRSSRWLIMKPRRTLFLPGDLAHKVFTIEPYIGVGSFYFSLPGAFRTLQRWVLREPGASTAARLDRVTRVAERRVRDLRKGPKRERDKWGLTHMQSAAVRCARGRAPMERSLMANDAFARVLAAAT